LIRNCDGKIECLVRKSNSKTDLIIYLLISKDSNISTAHFW
jgi:hypothetical protein